MSKKHESEHLHAVQDCGRFGFRVFSPLDPNVRGSQVNICHEQGYAIVQVSFHATPESYGNFKQLCCKVHSQAVFEFDFLH